MSVTANFGDVIHYNAFTEPTEIDGAVEAELVAKGFNMNVGAYPVSFFELYTEGDNESQTIFSPLCKIDELSQKIYLPTLDDVFRMIKKTYGEVSDNFIYSLAILFKTAYVNPSDDTAPINPAMVVIECTYSTE